MKCSNLKTQLFLVACLSFIQVSISHAEIVRISGPSGFTDPETLSFGAAEYGAISGSDSHFTDFGISSISAVASNAIGEEYARGDYEYALWADSNNGVQVVKDGDGCTTYNADGKCLDSTRTLSLVDFYDMSFSDDLTKIGFYMVDVWLPLEFIFYLDGKEVGKYDELARGDWDGNSNGTGNGWTQWRAFSSDIAFDQIKIESAGGDNRDGFGIALIRKEAVAVAAPASFSLLALSLFGLALTNRRKFSKSK